MPKTIKNDFDERMHMSRTYITLFIFIFIHVHCTLIEVSYWILQFLSLSDSLFFFSPAQPATCVSHITSLDGRLSSKLMHHSYVCFKQGIILYCSNVVFLTNSMGWVSFSNDSEFIRRGRPQSIWELSTQSFHIKILESSSGPVSFKFFA